MSMRLRFLFFSAILASGCSDPSDGTDENSVYKFETSVIAPYFYMPEADAMEYCVLTLNKSGSAIHSVVKDYTYFTQGDLIPFLYDPTQGGMWHVLLNESCSSVPNNQVQLKQTQLDYALKIAPDSHPAITGEQLDFEILAGDRYISNENTLVFEHSFAGRLSRNMLECIANNTMSELRKVGTPTMLPVLDGDYIYVTTLMSDASIYEPLVSSALEAACPRLNIKGRGRLANSKDVRYLKSLIN